MKLNSDLLNEVIADAKAVRETAVQTAISRLRETFEPTVRNLISQRLREEDGEEDSMEDTAPVAPPAPESDEMDMVEPAGEMPAPAPEEEVVEEELEFDDMDSYTDETFEDDEIFEEDYLDNGEEDEEFLAQILAELDEEVGDPESVESPMIPEEEDTMEEEENMDNITEEELDAMIGELEEEMYEEEMPEDETTMAAESRRRNGKRLRENWVNNWNDDEYDAQNDYTRNNQVVSENRKLKTQLRKANAQLKEAYRAINAQKSAINEVNLLNSKLLFLTKITSKHQLSPDKQIKVLEAFDRAKTVREVKLIYATIAENLNKTKTKGIMESASRPARAVKKSLNEQYDFAKRWQELAGISK
jgi:hypothetical protein